MSARRPMQRSSRVARPPVDHTKGWPTGPHGGWTAQGQLEQWGKIADGLTGNPRGRRRAGVMLLWLVGLVAVAAVLLGFLT